jgi:hypothetical protein
MIVLGKWDDRGCAVGFVYFGTESSQGFLLSLAVRDRYRDIKYSKKAVHNVFFLSSFAIFGLLHSFSYSKLVQGTIPQYCEREVRDLVHELLERRLVVDSPSFLRIELD